MSDRFTQVVTTYTPKLETAFGWTVEQACGVLGGNGGWESGLFTKYQQIGSSSTTGGRGWFMWTAKRRLMFLGYCKAHGFNPMSDEASYNFLCSELHGPYARVVSAVKRCKTVEAATETFERQYEAAGKPAMSNRIALARRALGIMRPGHPAASAPAKKPAPKKAAAPMAKKAKPKAAPVKKRTAAVAHVTARAKHH